MQKNIAPWNVYRLSLHSFIPPFQTDNFAALVATTRRREVKQSSVTFSFLNILLSFDSLVDAKL